jgi:phosphoglucosamine mutase
MAAPGTLLFGTDGFRGEADIAGTMPGEMNPATIGLLTHVMLRDAMEINKGTDPFVVVARDTRESGPALANAAMGAALGLGYEVWDVGVAPTPAAQKLAAMYNAAATVVLSASHNPESDNGLKIMDRSEKPGKARTEAVSEAYWKAVGSGLVVPTYEGGALDARERLHDYMDGVVRDVEEAFGAQPLKDKVFVYDGANGAAMNIAPTVLERLGATVHRFACDGEGPINEHCGATHLGGVTNFLSVNPEIVADERFVGALVNDGDADRMLAVGVVDGRFVKLDGNHVMQAMARFGRGSKPGGELKPEPGIVGTVYTNSALRYALQREGIAFRECANGDINVTQALREVNQTGHDWQRGGEFSGHETDLGWLNSGDGVRMAAWLAAYAAVTGQTFGEIADQLPLWPESKVDIALDKGVNAKAILESAGVIRALELADDHLETTGRHIVRASGTEPLIRIYVESKIGIRSSVVAHRLERAVLAAARVA